jgi:hypothetical protein
MSIQHEADTLLGIRIDPLELADLEEHASALRRLIVAFAEGLASPTWTAPARYNAMHLVKRLAVRLDETLSLIDDRRCDAAEKSESTSARRVSLEPPAP